MKKYPVYKLSGVEWLGEIPSNWSIVSLKHLVKIKITDGPHETPRAVEDGIPFVSAEAVQNHTINFDSKWGYITKEDHLKYSKKCKPINGDIFIVKSGATTGKVAYVDTNIDFNIWSPLALVRANEKLVYSRYLFNFIVSSLFQDQIQFSWSFGTQQNIGMGVIQNLQIITPPLIEQHSIIRFLDYKTDQIDRFIANRQKQIELLKEQKAAIINKAVTKGIDPDAKMKPSGIEWIGEIPEHWRTMKLKFVLKIFNGEGLLSELIKDEGEYEVIGGNGVLGYTNRFNVSRVTIVIGRVGAKCGNVHFFNRKVYVNDNAMIVKPFKNILPEYLNLVLETMNLNNLSTATAQPLLTSTAIKNKYIAIGNNEEQMQILSFIRTEAFAIDSLTSKYQKQIDLMQEYRTSLISQAVTGKIDVREWKPKKIEYQLEPD